MNNNEGVQSIRQLVDPISYRIAGWLRLASLVWMGGAILFVAGRLDSLELSPWDGVRVVGLLTAPGALGVLLSLVIESVGFSDQSS